MPASAAPLTVLPGATDQERILVVLSHTASGSVIELQQQSWGEGVGWFTQSTLPLQPCQAAALRQALGGSGQASPAARPSAKRAAASPRPMERNAVENLRIWQAESA